MVLIEFLFAPVAWVLGFGPVGPVAGSFAAMIQAMFYGAAVPSGGLFAFFQSIGMLFPSIGIFIYTSFAGGAILVGSYLFAPLNAIFFGAPVVTPVATGIFSFFYSIVSIIFAGLVGIFVYLFKRYRSVF